MKYLYTTQPDKHCHEVSPGVWGRPAQTTEQTKLRSLGWKDNPHGLRKEERRQEGQVSDDLAEQYAELFGKRPHHKMKPETIQEKISEALSDDEG